MLISYNIMYTYNNFGLLGFYKGMSIVILFEPIAVNKFNSEYLINS